MWDVEVVVVVDLDAEALHHTGTVLRARQRNDAKSNPCQHFIGQGPAAQQKHAGRAGLMKSAPLAPAWQHGIAPVC